MGAFTLTEVTRSGSALGAGAGPPSSVGTRGGSGTRGPVRRTGDFLVRDADVAAGVRRLEADEVGAAVRDRARARRVVEVAIAVEVPFQGRDRVAVRIGRAPGEQRPGVREARSRGRRPDRERRHASSPPRHSTTSARPRCTPRPWGPSSGSRRSRRWSAPSLVDVPVVHGLKPDAVAASSPERLQPLAGEQDEVLVLAREDELGRCRGRGRPAARGSARAA